MRSDTFLILFIVFIAIMTLWPLLLRRFQIPGVIALLIAGMLIGPNCLDLVRMLADTFSFLGGKTDVVVQNFDSLISSFGSLGSSFSWRWPEWRRISSSSTRRENRLPHSAF